MRDTMMFVGVVVAIAVLVMMCCAPEAKENFNKEHFKSVIVAVVPMIAFIVLVAFLFSHVGL